jgi:hypothetical protein
LSVLTVYQDRRGLDEAGLPRLLVCDIPTLTRLRLCRRPGEEEPDRSVEDDTQTIAIHLGIEPARLRQVVSDP